MAEILLIEKDQNRAQQWRACLEKAGHTAKMAETIRAAQGLMEQSACALIMMSARMSWAESFPFLQAMQEKGIPLLFVTAEGRNKSHLEAIYNGVCHVLVSPFTAKALVFAVEKLLRDKKEKLSCGGLQLNLAHKQVLMDGQPLSLTAQEFALLQALMQSPDTAVSREQLLRTAWGYQGIGETRTVDVHVQRLRKKLGCDRIETVYKLGYRLRMA